MSAWLDRWMPRVGIVFGAAMFVFVIFLVARTMLEDDKTCDASDPEIYDQCIHQDDRRGEQEDPF